MVGQLVKFRISNVKQRVKLLVVCARTQIAVSNACAIVSFKLPQELLHYDATSDGSATVVYNHKVLGLKI